MKVKTKNIAEYDKKNGKFETPNELFNIPSIGDSTLEKVKSHVRFN